LGRKVQPIGLRLGIIKDWESKWFAEGEEYARLLSEDIKIRALIHKQLGRAGISRIDIQRFPKRVAVTIVTAKRASSSGARARRSTRSKRTWKS